MELKHTFLFLIHIKYSFSQCPGKILPNYDKCYWLTKDKADWYDGNSTCFTDGGTPASFADADAYRSIVRLLGIDLSFDEVWIGVNDLQKECKFRNYDGSNLTVSVLGFLFDHETQGCENNQDALAIIPADNFTWQERRETRDEFRMLCEKDLDKSSSQPIFTTEFYSMIDTSTHAASVTDGSTQFGSTMSTEKINKMEKNPSDKTLIVGLLIGICVGVLFVIVIIIVICRRVRSKSPKSEVRTQKHTESKQGQKVYSYATMSYENDIHMEEKSNHRHHNKNQNTKTTASVNSQNYTGEGQYDIKPDGVYDLTSQMPKGSSTPRNPIENTYCLKPEGVYDESNHSQESTANKSRNNDVENNYGCSSTPESFYDSATQNQESKINKSLNNDVENNYGCTEKPEGVYDSAHQNQDHTKNDCHEIENNYGSSVKPEGVYDTSVQSPQYTRNQVLGGDVEDNYGCPVKPDGVYDSAVQKSLTQTTNNFENVYDH